MSQNRDMMNCDNYRKALAEDPGHADDSGHLDSCDACRAHGAELHAFDERMKAAMEISAPSLRMPELPDIDVENVRTLKSRRTVSTPAWYAIAATVALAAFVGFRLFSAAPTYGTLEDQVLAHLDHEPRAMRVSDTPVEDSRLSRAVPQSIATMNHDAGLITYAQSCTINGKTVPHLVVQGKRGPITILLMPDEMVSGASTIDGAGTHGVILPVGDGSIAIIGDREESLDRVRDNVMDSVTWGT